MSEMSRSFIQIYQLGWFEILVENLRSGNFGDGIWKFKFLQCVYIIDLDIEAQRKCETLLEGELYLHYFHKGI